LEHCIRLCNWHCTWQTHDLSANTVLRKTALSADWRDHQIMSRNEVHDKNLSVVAITIISSMAQSKVIVDDRQYCVNFGTCR
jgi:hypothetical protein